MCLSLQLFSSLLLIFYFGHLKCLSYYVGIGIGDITGPAVEVNMMGYANPSQTDSGIHLRLFSRAFIIKENIDSDPIVFISLDAGMTSQVVKSETIKRLKSLFNDTYTHSNVMISSTHTHSGPGGYFQYLLYTITSLGFVEQTYQAIVDGIVESVVKAHQRITEANIFYARGDLYNASINRSPASYMMNPPEERARYNSNTDNEMFLLKFEDTKGIPLGTINWFAVHGVSMNNTNDLISSDNKGVASILLETKLNEQPPLGKGPFVAAFAQAHEGDVSPNTKGPICIDTGEPCDYIKSTCNGRVEKCIAFGPGKDMFESTKIIGKRQFDKAFELFSEAKTELQGPVNYIHQYIDMTDVNVHYKDGRKGKTCKPAMGFSFAAGTTDGPGAFDFTQGIKNGSKFWNIIKGFIKNPSEELIACQAPKPILLATGEMTFPYEWQPKIIATQVFRLGPLLIAGLPGEFTTMSGRRIKAVVSKIAEDLCLLSSPPLSCKDNNQFIPIIAGLSNVYTGYVTTFEEYQLQRYEGASTAFGPHTLQAYIEQYEKLTAALIKGIKLPSGPEPPFFLDKVWGFLPAVIYDTAPIFHKYGDVLLAPNEEYNLANETVIVKFVSANPRNNMRLGGTFVKVEKLNTQTQNWELAYTDASWETKFRWYRGSKIDILLGRSIASVEWTLSNIMDECVPGVYRIRHFGTSKSVISRPKYKDFEGVTKPFTVICGKA